MRNSTRQFRGSDGILWTVEVLVPGASNAMVVFRHPSDRGARQNRYAWYIWRGPEARSVTSRVSAEKVLASLSDAELARLFRRSMPISAGSTPLTARVS